MKAHKLKLNEIINVASSEREAEFFIDLQSHTFALIEIDQGDNDVEVEIRRADRTVLGVVDSRERGPQFVSICAPNGGFHSVGTRLREAVTNGSYTAKLIKLGAQNDDDADLAMAEQICTEARKLLHAAPPKTGARPALDLYFQAIPVLERINNPLLLEIQC